MKLKISGPKFETEERECISWRRIGPKTIWIVFEDKEQMWESPGIIEVTELEV